MTLLCLVHHLHSELEVDCDSSRLYVHIDACSSRVSSVSPIQHVLFGTVCVSMTLSHICVRVHTVCNLLKVDRVSCDLTVLQGNGLHGWTCPQQVFFNVEVLDASSVARYAWKAQIIEATFIKLSLRTHKDSGYFSPDLSVQRPADLTIWIMDKEDMSVPGETPQKFTVSLPVCPV